jgi:ribosome modulation factor
LEAERKRPETAEIRGRGGAMGGASRYMCMYTVGKTRDLAP